jgi:tRNA threonylcarbamoyladenosine biosynthesis protein TsaB
VLLLAVETATDRVSVAVADRGEVRAELAVAGRQRHAEQLTPAIGTVCDLAGVALADLDGLAVGVGPGLFTGLRVGLATVQSLGFALGLTVAEVSSLDALAYPLRHHPGPVVAVLDARRSEVFWACYQGGARLGDPCVTRPDQLQAALADRSGLAALAAERELAAGAGNGGGTAPMLCAGDGAMRYRDVLATAGPHVGFAGADHAHPSAAAVAALGTQVVVAGGAVAPTRVRPVYLRAPDAVANWQERDRVVSGA